MRIQELLEDFDVAAQLPASCAGMSEEALEGLKLAAFEDGYRAGWDDAIKAQSDDQTRISSDFAQNLQDMSFTYHEAYSQVLSAMNPLLEDIVRSVLPRIAHEALGLHILEQLKAQSRAIGALGVEIVVAPENIEAVSGLLDQEFGFPLSVTEDDTMSGGQADIRFGKTEQQIDLTSILSDVSSALQGFVNENRKKVANG
ncbi:ABC transporter ATP-binding protein [Puniceibacterium confluentis]|uniref:ABC transporter ATP-binding protein n=2 Tax=Puniceibacterium confluentis TaxID=1958944 RepID=UPI001FE28A60|nr:ABC transporter ATP-binding protein [Puniceibacterium confluentis]